MLSKHSLLSLLVLGLLVSTCKSDPPASGGGPGGASSSLGGSAGAPGAGGSGVGGSVASSGGGSGGGSGGSAASGGNGAGVGGSSTTGPSGAGEGGGGDDATGGSLGDGGSAGSPDDDTATLQVTPEEGGTLTLGGTTLHVPPGAVATTTEITIKYIDPNAVEDLPAGFTALGPTVALLPHGLTFDIPVSITIEAASAPAEGVRSVFRLDDEQDTSWQTLGDVTFAATSATFETTTFSVLTPGAFTTELVHAAGGTVKIGDMAMSGNRLFYGISESAFVEIRAVNTDGTNPAAFATVSEPAVALQAITATESAVYFIVGNTLYSVPVGGGSLQTLGAVSSSSYKPYGGVPSLVSDGTLLFYAYLELFGASGIQSFDLSGTLVDTLPDLYPTTLELDGDTLLSNALELGGVLRIDKTLDPASVTPEIAASDIEGFGVVSMVHDATSVYVLSKIGAETPTIALWRKPAGGAVQPIFPPGSLSGEGCGLLLAEPFLYFVEVPIQEVTNENPDRIGQPVLGRIDKRSTNGVATGIAYANASTVLQDDNFIYYSSGTNIRRLPR